MDEADFLRFSEAASDFIDFVTFYRINDKLLADRTASDKIKRACCACADVMREQNENGNVSQEHVGNHSLTFSVPTKAAVYSARLSAVKMYLSEIYSDGVKIMYRGVS